MFFLAKTHGPKRYSNQRQRTLDTSAQPQPPQQPQQVSFLFLFGICPATNIHRIFVFSMFSGWSRCRRASTKCCAECIYTRPISTKLLYE